MKLWRFSFTELKGQPMRPLDKLWQLKNEARRKLEARQNDIALQARLTALEEAVDLVNQYLEHESMKEEK